MENILKKGLLILICAVLTFSFVGCTQLDDMRSRHALLQENGDISWQGVVYKELPASHYLNPYIDSGSASLCLTEADVPVLLSESSALAYLVPCEDGTFLKLAGTQQYYYCREDLYDQVMEELNTPYVPEVMFLTRSVYNKDTDTTQLQKHVLSQEQFAVIERIVTYFPPTPMYNATLESENDPSFQLMKATKSLLRQLPYATVYAKENGYFLLITENGSRCLFQVPKAYESYFSDLATIALSK